MTRPYESTSFEEISNEVIQLLKDSIEVNTVFIANNDKKFNYIMKAYNREYELLQEGDTSPFDEVLCKLVVDQPGEPVVINSLREHSLTESHPITKKMGDGCFLGVPIYTVKGRNVGTVCVFDSKPYHFKPLEIRLIKTLGGLLSQSLVLHVLNNELEQKQEKMENDLQVAQEIQQVVLPSYLETDDLIIRGLYKPAEKVGGDMYIWHELGDQQYAVMMVDVSSHGLPAALISMSIQSLFQQQIEKGANPIEILSQLNSHMNRFFEETGQYYCTCIYLLIDVRNHLLTYLNAGHPEAYLFSKDGTRTPLTSQTHPLGFFKEIQLKTTTVPLEKGANLHVYTDGLLELIGLLDSVKSNRLNGEETLQELSEKLPDQLPDDLCFLHISVKD
ncbi:GAF domain-containing SpoIIE family protein phosphatase [Bacillus sp. AK128]